MCGIAALFSFDASLDPAWLVSMTDRIQHRGPDDEGMVLFFEDQPPLPLGGKDTPEEAYAAPLAYAPRGPIEAANPTGAIAALAHRRLSILDLSVAGHQPMCSADGRYWMTYNGEVYNYLELRDELEGLGHRFATETDTEVILTAFAQWGAACLDRFNGMWAFVIVDRHANRAFAARDRFGVKPLYYWVSPRGFLAMGSEIKQFTDLPGWDPVLNGQRAYDFLQWGLSDHTAETLFEGVFQLRGGVAAEFDLARPLSRLPAYRWYDLQASAFSDGFHEASRAFGQVFHDAVKLRLRADVPLGSCLSGGLDSSSIVCVANDLLAEQGASDLQRTFSACTTVKRFDERDYIEEVVRARNLDARYTYPDHASLFETLGDLTWHQDEPFASTSIYAQWHVFKSASDHGVRVMLDGQGADEQLAGYRIYHAPRLASLLQSFQWRRLGQEIRASRKLHGFSYGDVLKQIANATMPGSVIQALARLRGLDGAAPEWLNLPLLAAAPGNPFLKGGKPLDRIDGLSHAQLTTLNLPMLLHWEDRNSMAHSVESRLPFLDYRLVELVLGMPDDFKLSGGISKRVMRDAMTGILPERIRMRMDKLGFATPEEVWVREQAPEQFREALRQAVEHSRGILRPEVEQVLERMISGERPYSSLAWRWISFGAWMQRFKVRIA